MNNASFNIVDWLAKHPQSQTEAIINSTISDMKATYGVKRIGGTGYW